MAREIDLYEEAIGNNAGDDFILQPEKHADLLPANAGALKRVLKQSHLTEIVKQYLINDERAEIAQKKYKRWGKTAIWSVFLAVVLGSLVTSLPLGDMFAYPHIDFYARLAAIAIILFALFLSFFIMSLMEWLKPFEKWNKARGKAEQARKDLFLAVFDADSVGTALEGELKLLPLKLEYFRRYLLGDQMIYYKKRGGIFEKSERHTRNLWLFATLVVFVLLLITLFIGVLSPAGEQGSIYNMYPEFSGLLQNLEVDHLDNYVLAGGIILAALFAAKLSISLLERAKGNAIRYSFTYANLKLLKDAGLETARQNALAGNERAVKEFVTSVMAQISAEHQDWIKLHALTPQRTQEPSQLIPENPASAEQRR
ncbi:MAG: hypothetical protein GY927_23365 [bacterium]|nr:hypothetical protein [bacterium]